MSFHTRLSPSFEFSHIIFTQMKFKRRERESLGTRLKLYCQTTTQNVQKEMKYSVHPSGYALGSWLSYIISIVTKYTLIHRWIHDLVPPPPPPRVFDIRHTCNVLPHPLSPLSVC